MSSESAIELRCSTYVAKYGGVLLKIQKRKGWPDRLCILPNGRHFFIEFKKPGGELDPLQQYWLKWLNDNGHAAFEVDNRHLFERLFHERLSLPPP